MNTKTQEALHKALKVLNCLNNNRVYETAWVKGAIQACKEALAELQEHDNEVIERCAKVCESLKEQDYCVDVRAGAEAIRALKGKQNGRSSFVSWGIKS